MARLAFDIDGTLLHHDSKPDYETAAGVQLARPDPEACRRVAKMIQDGHAVRFITGRAEKVRSATVDQLCRAIGVPIPSGYVYMQEAWQGYDAMRDYKADCLRRTRAEVYVGDHAMDQAASQDAGCLFIHANDWRDGMPIWGLN